MKAVIQRVVNASVAVDGRTISSIGRGLLVLVGIDRYDTPADATQIIKKILTARLFDDDQGAFWKKNVKETDGEVLCVSQFTLLANFKGSKPDFHESMSTVPGKAFYSDFMEEIKRSYHPDKIKDGEFGAMMQVSLTNDGPVTILLSSRDKPSRSSTPASTPTLTPVGARNGRASGSDSGTSTRAPGSGSGRSTKPSSRSSSVPPQLSGIVTRTQPVEDGTNGSANVVREANVATTGMSVSEGEMDVDPSRTRRTGDDDHPALPDAKGDGTIGAEKSGSVDELGERLDRGLQT